MAKADMCTGGTGGNDVADLHIAVRDNDSVNDSVNEEFHQLAALGEGRLGKAPLDLLAESRNRYHYLCDGLVLVHVHLQLLSLPFQGVETFV